MAISLFLVSIGVGVGIGIGIALCYVLRLLLMNGIASLSELRVAHLREQFGARGRGADDLET